MVRKPGLPPLFGAPWEREDVEFNREAAREAAREAEQRAAQREAAEKLRGEFFRRVPDPNMPILFIPPWERAEAQGKPRRKEKPDIPSGGRYKLRARFRDSIDELISYEWLPTFHGRRTSEGGRGSWTNWVFDFETRRDADGFRERILRLRSLDMNTAVYEE